MLFAVEQHEPLVDPNFLCFYLTNSIQIARIRVPTVSMGIDKVGLEARLYRRND